MEYGSDNKTSVATNIVSTSNRRLSKLPIPLDGCYLCIFTLVNNQTNIKLQCHSLCPVSWLFTMPWQKDSVVKALELYQLQLKCPSKHGKLCLANNDLLLKEHLPIKRTLCDNVPWLNCYLNTSNSINKCNGLANLWVFQ